VQKRSYESRHFSFGLRHFWELLVSLLPLARAPCTAFGAYRTLYETAKKSACSNRERGAWRGRPSQVLGARQTHHGCVSVHPFIESQACGIALTPTIRSAGPAQPMAAASPVSMSMSVLEEAGDGPQRERRRQGSNFLAAGLHKAAAAGDWAAVQRALVPSVFDPLGLIYHILGFNAHPVMEELNEVHDPNPNYPRRRNPGPRFTPRLRPRPHYTRTPTTRVYTRSVYVPTRACRTYRTAELTLPLPFAATGAGAGV
jgi:hypothetical protein